MGQQGGTPTMAGLPGVNQQVPGGLGQGGPVSAPGGGSYTGMSMGQHNIMGPN